jgi:hypothetical protein
MTLNKDQIDGSRIVLAAFILGAMALVCSNGWGSAQGPLWLYQDDFQYGDYFQDSIRVTILTKYVIAVLLAVAGYGTGRFFALIPPLFMRKIPTKGESNRNLET